MGRYSRLGLFKRPRKADRDVALDCLRKVGMKHLPIGRYLNFPEDSNARFWRAALAQQANVYFMDEPFAGVDATTEKQLSRCCGRWHNPARQ